MTAKSYRAEPETDASEQDAGAEQGEPETDAPETPETAAGETGDSGAEGGASEADLEAEINDLRERLTRAMAETENVRRRAERERKDALKYAAAPLAKDLLGVIDNLRRALDSVPAEEIEGNETLKTLISGVEMTEKELHSAFEKHGIHQIAVEPGQRFDPHYHEAMFEVPTDQQQPGTIVHVLQHGYMLHDRLLRPSRVGVAKSAGGQSNTQGNVDTSA